MNVLDVNFEHCYGIKKLQHTFDFHNRTFAIYAPNGVMKTSFSKTFYDISNNIKTTDIAFPDRDTTVCVKADGNDLEESRVFVIESYNPSFKSEKISTLLANKTLKSEYEKIHKEIEKSKKNLLKQIKTLSGLTNRKDNIEKIVSAAFGLDFYQTIVSLEEEVLNGSTQTLHQIKYQEIFKDKVVSFLETKDFRILIQEYIEKYDQLLDQSPYLGKKFKFHHAENIQKQLSLNNFFTLGHSVNLYNGKEKHEYFNSEELKLKLEDEKNKIFDNDELKRTFNEIDKKLTNQDLRDFRDYLLQNKIILPELHDLNSLKNKLLLSYFVESKDLFLELVRKYKDGQEAIEQLVQKANGEFTEWESVIKIFNTRFSHLPFHLNIKNKEDVILKSEVESIEFVFNEGNDRRVFDQQGDLLQILSTGEQRALYILNIIFEVEARKKEGAMHFFVIDDIADSFDYKNKYAIVEYLKHMSDEANFRMIILTHNFDFYRTLQSRDISSYGQCLIALKNELGIRLKPIKYLKNPFINDWKNNLDDSKKLIASIPFVRNLIEYIQGENDSDYLRLTSVLHMKNDTKKIKLEDIQDIFGRTIHDISFPKLSTESRIYDLIVDTADECLDAPEGINLENKIVLSIASRLLSERYMINSITDMEFLNDLGVNQYWKLLKKYEEEFNNRREVIDILKRVSLITSENIHINSFMYEPILDMGDSELKSLYRSVKEELT